MRILWTRHAEERQRQWQVKLGVTRAEVEETVGAPEQIRPGDRGALVAQTRRGKGLLRVPFVESGGDRTVLTVYWTSHVAKYREDGTDEDSL